jgi:hypothetical protein
VKPWVERGSLESVNSDIDPFGGGAKLPSDERGAVRAADETIERGSCFLFDEAAGANPDMRRLYVKASRRTVTANRPHDPDDAGQWLLTLFLGPIAAVLAAIVIGLLMRGSGLR